MFAFASYQMSQKFSSHFYPLFKLATLTQEGKALVSKNLALQRNLLESKAVVCTSPYKEFRIGILKSKVGNSRDLN